MVIRHFDIGTFVARKWLIASAVAFVAALGCEIRAKQFGSAAMVSIAKRTAGIAVQDQAPGWARQADVMSCIGMCVAGVALICWVISAIRREPGSFLLVIIPAILYGLVFLILV